MKPSPTKGGLFDRFLTLLLGSGPSGPAWRLDGESMAECRRRLRLADNQNPSPHPDWVRPPAPQAPPHRNPGPGIGGPINHTPHGKGIAVGMRRADGTFFVGLSTDPEYVEQMKPYDLAAENDRLVSENKSLRHQLAAAKSNERKLAWRIEKFRKAWPAIHKSFFTAKGKAK